MTIQAAPSPIPCGPPPAPRKRGRARRVAAAIGKGAGVVVVFVVAIVGGILLHGGMRAPRAFALERVNAILAGSFVGRIDLRRIDVLRLDRLGGVEADVYDPEGKRVIHVEGVDVKFGIVTIVKSLLGGGRIAIGLHDLHVRHAEILVEDDAEGRIGLVRAFDSPEPPPVDEEPSAGTEVTIRGIALDHAWIHGRLAGAPVIDVDLASLIGDFSYDPEATEIAVDGLDVRARGIPGLSPVGHVVAHVVLPAEEDTREVRASYRGLVGEIPVEVAAALTGNDVVARLDVAETSPEAIRAISPETISLRAPVKAHAEVTGTLPTLYPVLVATVGTGRVTATGSITLPEGEADAMVASAELEVVDLDLSVLQEGLPLSDLDTFVAASIVSHPGGALEGDFAIENQPGDVAGQVVPRAEVDGTFTERSVVASARIHEVGAPTTLDVTLEPRAGEPSPSLLTFATRTEVPSLGGIARVKVPGSGRATVSTRGTIDLEAKTIAATVSGDASKIAVAPLTIERTQIGAEVAGTFDAPTFTSRVFVNGLAAEGYTFESVTVDAGGSPEAIDVRLALATESEKTPAVEGSARIRPSPSLAIEDVVVTAKRVGIEARATVARVSILDGGGVDVRQLALEGLGQPLRADARYAGERLVVRAHTDGIDVARIGKLLAREEDFRGTVALDVDAKIDPREANGHVDVDARDVHAMGIDGGSAKIAVALEGKKIRGKTSVGLPEVGGLTVDIDEATLGGPLLSSKGILESTGDVRIDGTIDLAALVKKLPDGTLPIGEGKGTVTVKGTIARPTAEGYPSFDLEVTSKGLVVAMAEEQKRDAAGKRIPGDRPFRVEGVDGTVKARFDGDSGKTVLAASLHDAKGPLVTFDADTVLPVKELFAPGADPMTVAETLPVAAHVIVPRRDVESLPGGLVEGIEGKVELRGDFEGTIRQPKIALSGKIDGLRPEKGIACQRSIDVVVTGGYDGKKAEVDVRAKSGGREVAHATAMVDVAVDGLLAAQKRAEQKDQAVTETPLAWEASAALKVDRFPLETMNAFLPQPIGGTLSGNAKIDRLHRDATLDASFSLDDLEVERQRIPSAKLVATIDKGTFAAEAKLTQSDGHLAAKITGAATWGEAIAPDFDLKKPVDLTLDAKRFRIAAARPFVGDVFSELDGRLDSNAKLRVLPGGKDGTFEGTVVVSEGVFAVPQIGERFSKVSARVVMKPWGTVRLEKLEASGPTGRLTGSAEAVFDGLAFQKANARFDIPEGESIPIAVEGVPMGRAHGKVTAKVAMSQKGKKLDADIDVPMLKVDLPQSTGNSVQDLADDEKIQIGFHDGKKLVPVPLKKPEPPAEPSDLVIATRVKLGEDVRIKRDTTLDVWLRGNVAVEITDQTKVSGQIRLVQGKIELQGKIFEVERGIVSFVGTDPGDPLIQATAFWDAPGDVRVYADFTGHVSEGKLTLRSEPPYSEDEILALVLFGSTDGAFGSSKGPKQSDGVAAVGVAGGVVTQGLNKILSGVTPDISTRIDSSEANSPQPQIVWQITKDVSASLGYKLGVPAPGADPDRAQLSLDWRFVRNWSLDTKVGDQGSTSVDVIWRLRY